MKVIAYSPIHYGLEYFKESLLSVVDVVDRFVVLYTPVPSYGYGTASACPDNEGELKAIAQSVLGDKLQWITKGYNSEGQHRDEIYKYAHGYDVLLAVDADEVFHTEELKKAIEIVAVGAHRNYGIKGYVNLWRNFDTACYDGFLPIRLINLKNRKKEMSNVPVTIWHFSTCQSETIMRYKYEIHGHKSEIRGNWLDDVYYGETMEDLHPVAIGLWNAVKYDKELMPDYLKEHPNYNKDRV